MLSKRYVSITTMLLCALIATVLVGACSWTGRTVQTDRVFELQQGDAGQGTLQTSSLTFTYQYTLQGNALSMTGDVEFLRRQIRTFHMSVHFVDADGVILESAFIVPRSAKDISGTIRGNNLPVNFEGQVPEGAQSMALQIRPICRRNGPGC